MGTFFEQLLAFVNQYNDDVKNLINKFLKIIQKHG